MKEYEVEKQIFVELRKAGFIVMKLANEATYRRRLYAVMRGAPDLVAISPSGEVYWLEIKTQRGKLTRIQRIAHDALQRYGQKVFVIRNLEELKAILK